MSLILDALNRSRQDANAVPGLDTQHRAAGFVAERRPYLLWGALALCGVVIAALVVDRLRAPSAPAEDIGAPVAQLSQNLGSAVSSVTTELKARAAAGQAQPSLPATPVPQPAAQAPAPAPAPAVAPSNPQPASTAAANEPQLALPAAEPAVARPEPARPDAVRESAGQTARSVAAASSSAEPDDEVAQLYEHPDNAEAPAATTRSRSQSAADETEQPVDLDKVLKMAQEEMKNAKLEDNGVPFLADLSQQTKDAVPTIYYQKHDYSSDPSVSSVTLNGNTIKAGGALPSGLKVEEILGDSVVLSFNGTQFRLRALNSWINL